MRTLLHPITLALLAALAGGATGRADEFVLESGGRIVGDWLNRAYPNSATYEVRTESGGQVSLAKEQVREVLPRRTVLEEYKRIVPNFADTVAEQWKLAEWCREKNLKDQRTVHLLRILDHDSNHFQARLALGFTQVSGQWVMKEEWKKSKGYENYRGRWRLAQEIELLEERHKADQAQREWIGKLKKIRSALGTDRAQLAAQQLFEIRDPYAVRGLLENLRREPLRDVKLMYVEVLGKIESPAALDGLIFTSLNDPDNEVFYACLEQIVPRQTPAVVESYVQALRNDNNLRINRAGAALARFQDKSTISPLISALVTRHGVVTGGGASSDAISTTFSQPAGGGGGGSAGLSAGGSPARVVPVVRQNPEVLKALVAITDGTSFGYDQRAWSRWYAQQQSRIDLRGVGRDGGR